MSGFESQNVRRARFAANWVVGAEGASWSQRRRLMAVLRRAHRVLGVNRDKLGLGGLGTTNPSSAAAAASGLPLALTGKTGLFSGVALAALSVVATPQTAFAQVAIGNGVNTNAATCSNPSATVPASVAIGCGSSATGSGSTAVGTGVAVSGNNTIGLGTSVTVTTAGGIGLGYSLTSNGLNAIAIGFNTNATGINALAVGGAARASAEGSSAFGVNSFANGAGATAIGNGANATGVATAVGVASQATSAILSLSAA